MTLFQPMLSLSLDANGEYTLHSTTLGPNSCAKAGKYEFGAPEGQSIIKEATPITLYIDTKPSNYCLQVLTPVYHKVPNIKKLGPSNFLVEVFVIYRGEVRGTQIIHFDQALDSEMIKDKKALNTFKVTTYHLSGNGMKLILSMEDPNEMTLELNDSNGERKFYGKEIYRDETKLGLILSVVIEFVPDLHEIILSLAVPVANRPENMKSVNIKTYALRTINRSSIIGPPGIEGQTQVYEALSLEGNAW